jgi:hypothetical protein
VPRVGWPPVPGWPPARPRARRSTLSSWISVWRREGIKTAKPKVVAPKAKKAKVKTEPTSKPVNGAGEVTPAN